MMPTQKVRRPSCPSVGVARLISCAEPDASEKEILSSWSLFILIMLLITALFASYILQTRRIQAVHETVMSIFAGEWLILNPLCFRSCVLRNGYRTDPTARRRRPRLAKRQLQLPNVLQSPPPSYHSRFRIRAASGALDVHG